MASRHRFGLDKVQILKSLALHPTTQQILKHDPDGEADLVAGFTRTAIGCGDGVRYSLKNLGACWQVDGRPGTGWWIQLSR